MRLVGLRRNPLDLFSSPSGPSGLDRTRPFRIARMNMWKRPSWTWRRLQSASRRTGPTLVDPPLMGFVLVVCPAVDIPVGVHSPATSPPPFGPHAVRHLDTFRPRGSSPPRRFTPHDRPRVCCTPKPNGVRYVSQCVLRPGTGRNRFPGADAPLPATRFTPLEEFPSPAAVPRHRGRCPLAVLANIRPASRRSARTDRLPVPTSRPASPPHTAEAVFGALRSASIRTSLFGPKPGGYRAERSRYRGNALTIADRPSLSGWEWPAVHRRPSSEEVAWTRHIVPKHPM